MKNLRSLLCILLVLVMSVSLFACKGTQTESPSSSPSKSPDNSPGNSPGSSPSSSSEALSTDEYVVRTIGITYMGQFISGLSPTENYPATNAVFDQVFLPDPATKTVTSRILKDWYTEDNGFTWILKMRDDIYFNNGDNAKANDLLYTYTSYGDRGSGQINGYGIDWDECKTLDDYTVQIKFERPYSGFQYAHQINLLNEKWCREVGWDSLEWQHPVGSGPYYCDVWEQDVQIVLKLRDDYWYKDEGPYYVDEWVLKCFSDQTTQFMELETGAIDMCAVSSADYSRYVKNGGDGYEVRLASAGVTHSFYFGMIDRYPLWQDQKMRDAIAYAIPWEELGKIVYADMYIPANSIATSQNPYHIDPGQYEYNPEKAKQLLEECGYGPDNPLKLETTQMQTDRTTLEAVQFYLNQVGIELTINFVDTATASTIYRSREGNDIATWFAHRGSAFHELRASIPYAGAFHESFEYIEDEEFQDLYHKMQESSDEESLGQYCRELQQLVFDKVLIIPFAELPFAMGYRTDKFNEKQIADFCITSSILQLGRLGLLSSWN